MVKKLVSFSILLALAISSVGQLPTPPFPVKRIESAESWARDGWNALTRAKRDRPNTRRAKNVILFVGDGMGISTLTAARTLEGQMRGESGEENRLSFEEFPYSALSKTYSTNQQTSDSAPTMSAIVTGVKTDEGVLSVDQDVIHGNYRTVKGNETKTILEMVEESGRSTGVVSTARLTHATPAACYAHTASRDWESDKDIHDRKLEAYGAGFADIARQMIESPYGDGIEVALGGGRTKFQPKDVADPEYQGLSGDRLDRRDLAREWVEKRSGSSYVWNREQFYATDAKRTRRLLGLFEPSHMQYEHERKNDRAGEPSLGEMTTKAIDILSQNRKGYFLMVEGGRIDHGHHDGSAYRALTETIELSNAVRAAMSKVDPRETLVIVTADHSHTLTIQGYPMRGNNILGLVREIGSDGAPEPNYKKDKLGLPFTTLGYANGPGARSSRIDLSKFDTTGPNFLQESAIGLTAETHGGEDVAIYATGPNAYLVRGSMEQNWIFYVMADAMRLARK